MAYDFPASPANGATYNGWTYNSASGAWLGGPSAAAGGMALIEVADTAPAGAIDRTIWWESDSGALWLRFNDGSSTQWVMVNAPPGSWLPLSGGTLSGDLTISKATPVLDLRKAASGQSNVLYGRTGANARWSLELGHAAGEGGSNTGSDFVVSRHNDAGTWLDQPFVINRATGNVTAQGLAPAPAASGVGQWQALNSTSGGSVTLPAGGTWAYALTAYNSVNSLWGGPFIVSRLAGGTVVGGAQTNIIWTGFCWRIA